jgi:Co/Zn/Cd efflux system component
VFAIVGLLCGRFFGWVWMDAAMGIVGALVIASWSFGLIAASGRVLLDTTPASGIADTIRTRIETGDTKIADLHVWRIGPGHDAAILSIVDHQPLPPDAYRARIADLKSLSHVTIEVRGCD